MLFPRVNLRIHLGEKLQRGTTVTSKMSFLQGTYFRTIYSLFYMVYGLSIWYILHFTINVPNFFSPPADVLAAEHP